MQAELSNEALRFSVLTIPSSTELQWNRNLDDTIPALYFVALEVDGLLPTSNSLLLISGEHQSTTFVKLVNKENQVYLYTNEKLEEETKAILLYEKNGLGFASYTVEKILFNEEAKEIFYAEYEQTTVEELSEARSNNKTIFVRIITPDDVQELPLVQFSNGKYLFYGIIDKKVIKVSFIRGTWTKEECGVIPEAHAESHSINGADPLYSTDLGVSESVKESLLMPSSASIDDALLVLSRNAPVALETRGTELEYILDQPGFELTDGALVRFKLHVDSGATPTINVNNTGAKKIRIDTISALPTGIKAGTWLTAVYSSTLDFFVLQGSIGENYSTDAKKARSAYGNGIGQISSFELSIVGRNLSSYSRGERYGF